MESRILPTFEHFISGIFVQVQGFLIYLIHSVNNVEILFMDNKTNMMILIQRNMILRFLPFLVRKHCSDTMVDDEFGMSTSKYPVVQTIYGSMYGRSKLMVTLL